MRSNLSKYIGAEDVGQNLQHCFISGGSSSGEYSARRPWQRIQAKLKSNPWWKRRWMKSNVPVLNPNFSAWTRLARNWPSTRALTSVAGCSKRSSGRSWPSKRWIPRAFGVISSSSKYIAVKPSLPTGEHDSSVSKRSHDPCAASFIIRCRVNDPFLKL